MQTWVLGVLWGGLGVVLKTVHASSFFFFFNTETGCTMPEHNQIHNSASGITTLFLVKLRF